MSWLGGSVPHMFLDSVMSGGPRLNRLRLGPAPGLAPSFSQPRLWGPSLCRGHGGPLLQLHFCPWETRQRVATVRHPLLARPGPALVGVEKAGWPGPCPVSTHFLHLLNQSPRNSPCASQGQPRLEGWVPLGPEISANYREPPREQESRDVPGMGASQSCWAPCSSPHPASPRLRLLPASPIQR